MSSKSYKNTKKSENALQYVRIFFAKIARAKLNSSPQYYYKTYNVMVS